MNFKKNMNLKYLLLIIPLYLGLDFLPIWYSITYTLLICYLSFFKPIKALIYLNFIALYFIFKSIGIIIVPETMVPILGVFIVSRILANKIENHFEMYPIFLWIGAFSLFSSSFYYLIYTCITLLIIFLSEDGKTSISLKGIFRSLYQHKAQLVIITIASILLFIFFPRFHNFLPTTNLNTQGKIGYSKTINNSTTSNLLLSSQTAFFAELSTKVNPEYLYWRGRVHTRTDGYNWMHASLKPKKIERVIPNLIITQKIKYEQDLDGDIVLLNNPLKVIDTNLSVYSLPGTNEFRSFIKKKKSIITATSSLRIKTKIKLRKENRLQYVQIPKFIPSELKSFISEINGETPKEIINSFRRQLLREQFSYTLSPGLIPTMADFLKKKRGYCSHFSSLLGIVLRYHNIPTRLISGFQGGIYNKVGNFYEIKSNDAHVWVEYFESGSWSLIDPTSFVSPERIRLGGEQFLNSNIINSNTSERTGINKSLNTLKLYFQSINYKISLFLDNYDRTTQSQIAKNIKLGLKYFFGIGILLFILIMTLFYYSIKKKKKGKLHPADHLLEQLDKKLRKDKLNLSSKVTMKQMQVTCKDHKQKTKIYIFLNLYQLSRYGKENHYIEMKTIINSITK